MRIPQCKPIKQKLDPPDVVVDLAIQEFFVFDPAEERAVSLREMAIVLRFGYGLKIGTRRLEEYLRETRKAKFCKIKRKLKYAKRTRTIEVGVIGFSQIKDVERSF